MCLYGSLSYCTMVLPCNFSNIILSNPPNSSLSIRHNDIRIEQPGLQFRISLRKQEGPTAWESTLENETPFHGVVRSLCGRLAWFRTRKPAHSTTL
jgi:hypothetical protein